jgi:hypothetical protein
MFVARIGSLNALEQTTHTTQFWRRWLGAALPSADTLGRVMDCMDPDSVREMLCRVYTKLKRNKALRPTSHGLMALAIDGHEISCPYRRRSAGCRERRIETRGGDRLQYYYTQVSAMLLCADFPLLLDAEMLGPGDSEIIAARRLLARVLKRYPRAFDVAVGDALYSDAETFRLLAAHGKDAISVLKKNQPGLLAEAETLMAGTEPELEEATATSWSVVHDLEGFEGWSADQPLRVVRSREGRTVRRQLDGCKEDEPSQWYWLTTCSRHRADTRALVELAHARWNIENLGFNETVNRWQADHIYKHTTEAILVFWLVTMLAFNLFHAFVYRNLAPKIRETLSRQHIARCLASVLYADPPSCADRPP